MSLESKFRLDIYYASSHHAIFSTHTGLNCDPPLTLLSLSLSFLILILLLAPNTCPPIHSPPPRPIDKDAPHAHHKEQRADARADVVKVVCDDVDKVPEGPGGLSDGGDESEDLDEGDEGGDDDRDAGEDCGVVEHRNGVAREGGGGVERGHQGAVGGVKERHAG